MPAAGRQLFSGGQNVGSDNKMSCFFFLFRTFFSRKEKHGKVPLCTHLLRHLGSFLHFKTCMETRRDTALVCQSVASFHELVVAFIAGLGASTHTPLDFISFFFMTCLWLLETLLSCYADFFHPCNCTMAYSNLT